MRRLLAVMAEQPSGGMQVLAERLGVYDVALARDPDGGWRVVEWDTIGEAWS